MDIEVQISAVVALRRLVVWQNLFALLLPLTRPSAASFFFVSERTLLHATSYLY